ncbi:MAG: S26 family signal peptidase [Clostridia bacterium]|nr:S26 family signal peptidase [Clostridia bacterium]
MNRFEQTLSPIENEIFMESVEEMLNSGYEVDFTVTGNSMWPFLSHARDRVIVERFQNNNLKKGDIILFKPIPGKYLLHRIIKLNSDCFQTAGDGNCFSDGSFPHCTIVARVCKIIRKGKSIPADSLKYKIFSRCWTLLFPIRKPLLRLMISIVKIKK